MLLGLSSINYAYDNGRFHTQRFFKNAGTSHGTAFADWSFSSGQPAYDAHVGTALKFTPTIASGNDAIYFPPIDSNLQRFLVEGTFRGTQNNFTGPISLHICDLLGFYPLVDGDSTDEQLFDNSLSLPRYTSGESVGIVILNHVAPATGNGIVLITYIDQNDTQKSVTVTVPNSGINLVCSGLSPSANSIGSMFIPLASGSRGVKSIVSIQYTTAPGGLHCFMLVKTLATTVTAGDLSVASEKSFFSKNGFSPPRIYDGAWLTFFDHTTSGTARTVTWFGNLTFIWN